MRACNKARGPHPYIPRYMAQGMYHAPVCATFNSWFEFDSMAATTPKQCSKKPRTPEQQLLDPEVNLHLSNPRATYPVPHPRHIPAPMFSIWMASEGQPDDHRLVPLHSTWICANRSSNFATPPPPGGTLTYVLAVYGTLLLFKFWLVPIGASLQNKDGR